MVLRGTMSLLASGCMVLTASVTAGALQDHRQLGRKKQDHRQLGRKKKADGK